MKLLKIVILCYSYPPNPGVGGRRWAKFSKYLKRLGHEVVVITVEPGKGKLLSNYMNDVKDVPTVYYGSKSSSILSGKTHNVIEKIWYRLLLAFRTLSIAGTPFDQAGLDKKKVLRCLERINQENKIDVLISTGAPFHLTYFAAIFKKDKPNLKLITDFRDPWIYGGNYGISSLSEDKYWKEKQKEAFVIEHSDCITVPVEDMLTKLQESYTLLKHKFALLPHGYDTDYIRQKVTSKTPDKIKLIYYGTIYENCEEHLKFLNRMMLASEGKICLDYYGYLTIENHHILKESIQKGYLSVLSSVTEEVLFEKLTTYQYAVIMQRFDYGVHHIATKYYELIASRMPILFIGGQGKAYRFVFDHKLGVCFDDFKVDNHDFYQQLKSFSYHPDVNIESKSFESLTKKLVDLIAIS